MLDSQQMLLRRMLFNKHGPQPDHRHQPMLSCSLNDYQQSSIKTTIGNECAEATYVDFVLNIICASTFLIGFAFISNKLYSIFMQDQLLYRL